MSRKKTAWIGVCTLGLNAVLLQSALANKTLETLAIYKHNTSLTHRIRTILAKRNDPAFDRQFAELWG